MAAHIVGDNGVRYAMGAKLEGRERALIAWPRLVDPHMERNPRIMRAVPQGMDSIEPLQGTVEGASGSWVRLTGGLRSNSFLSRETRRNFSRAEA